MKNNFFELKKLIKNIKVHNFNFRDLDHQNFFSKIKFDDTANDINDLSRFVDTHKKNSFSKKKDYTFEDKLIIDKILEFFSNFTLELFNKQITPIDSIYSDLKNFKIIQKFLNLHKSKENINILEIGPGPGCLGLMLSENKNVNYTSIENSEGFYIYQSFLYEFYTKYFDETLKSKSKNLFDSQIKIKHFHSHDIINIEKKIYSNQILDLATMNHCIGEFNPDMRNFYLKIVHEMMLNSYRKYKIQPFLIINSIGAQGYLSFKSFFEIMHRFNFKRIIIPKIQCYVFTVNDLKIQNNFLFSSNNLKLNKIIDLIYYIKGFKEFNKIKKKINLDYNNEFSFNDLIENKKLYINKEKKLSFFFKNLKK